MCIISLQCLVICGEQKKIITYQCQHEFSLCEEDYCTYNLPISQFWLLADLKF